MPFDKLTFGQSLHGYLDGHRLVSSSVPLDPDSRMTVRILSDSACVFDSHGKQDYLTGYPLAQAGLYVLARTWPAPEMARPGCVWTHSIYIRFQDIGRIYDFVSLTALFDRPSIERDYSRYSKPIEWESVEPNGRNPMIGPEILRSIISAFYQLPNSAVLIEAANEDKLEVAILELWRQQWSRLRRSFTFCTYSNMPRLLVNHSFDLQVCPRGGAVKFREVPKLVVVDGYDKIVRLKEDANVELILNDILLKGNELGLFIKVYGPSLVQGRSGMLPLVSIFKMLASVTNVDGLLHIIDLTLTIFPDKNDAKPLKNIFLGESQILPNCESLVEEESKLCYLATTKKLGSFEWELLTPANRFLNYFVADRMSCLLALNSCVINGINEIGQTVIENIAFLVNEADITTISKIARPLFVGIVLLNPNIATLSSFWEVSEAECRENIDILFHPSIRDNVDWINVTKCMITADVKVPLQVVKRFGSEFVHLILNIANDKIPVLLEDYRSILVQEPERIVSWLNMVGRISSGVLGTLPLLLDPNGPAIEKLAPEAYLKLRNAYERSLRTSIDIRSNTFLLVIALRSKQQESFGLMEVSFEPIYFAIYHNMLDYELWRQLEIHTPSLQWWKEWDKCKKLRKALVNKAILFGMTRSAFRRITSDSKLLSDLDERFSRER